MMKSMLRWAPAFGLVAASAMTAACSGSGLPTSLGNTPAAQAPVANGTTSVRLDASSTSAKQGDRIAVAIVGSTTTGTGLGGLQGVLSFDASKLRYAGQQPNGSAMAIVNAGAAAQGRLNVASLDVLGLAPQTAILAFDVIGDAYTAGLSYSFQAGGALTAKSGQIALRNATVTPGVSLGTVVVPAQPKIMTRGDWTVALRSNGPKVNFVPGETGKAGLKFGDANLSNEAAPSSSVDINDALDLALVTVGSQSVIAGTDGTTSAKDLVLAGNVFPANLPGLGEAGDALPPGVEGGSATAIDNRNIDINDALEVALFTVGQLTASNSVVGQLIPGRSGAALGRVVVGCPIATQTWTTGNVYELPAPTGSLPTCEITGVLTIQPGVRVEAGDQQTLVVTRAGQIFANGTLAQPIVFDCKNPVTGPYTPPVGAAVTPNGSPTPGCFGGLYINGNAPINNGTLTSPAIRNSSAGAREQSGEGSTGLYGGGDVADNSGTLRFVQILNAGTRFTATNERNGLTLQGVGSGTTIDYVQIDNGLDDGVEFFGGTVNVKHLLITRSQDDGFDWVAGFSGKAQFVIVRGCDRGCDRGIEADNFGIDAGGDPTSTPYSNPTLYNFTLVGSPTDQLAGANGLSTTVSAGVILRQDTKGTLRNFIIANYKASLDIDQPDNNRTRSQGICTWLGDGSLSIRNVLTAGSLAAGDNDGVTVSGTAPSIIAANEGDPISPYTAPVVDGSTGAVTASAGTCGGYAVNNQRRDLEASYIAASANNWSVISGQSATDLLVAPFAGYVGSGASTPSFAPWDFSPKGAAASATGATPPSDGFFDASANYLGAVKPGSVPWYSGWTLPVKSN